MNPKPPAGAKRRILHHLKTKGPQSAARLAKRLEVTPMAVRQHLYQLADDGLVAYLDERRRVGRPARIWRLTEASAGQFPDNHAELALGVIQAAKAAFGPNGFDRLLTQRVKQQLAEYRKRIDSRLPLDEKVAALAVIRREEGYMAEHTRQPDGSLLLVENNCPICTAAKACQGLCSGELELFRKLLGRSASIERTEYMLDGDRRCAYRIRPKPTK